LEHAGPRRRRQKSTVPVCCGCASTVSMIGKGPPGPFCFRTSGLTVRRLYRGHLVFHEDQGVDHRSLFGDWSVDQFSVSRGRWFGRICVDTWSVNQRSEGCFETLIRRALACWRSCAAFTAATLWRGGPDLDRGHRFQRAGRWRAARSFLHSLRRAAPAQAHESDAARMTLCLRRLCTNTSHSAKPIRRPHTFRFGSLSQRSRF